MYDKDFAELVKIAAEKLKEDTVYKNAHTQRGLSKRKRRKG